MTVGSIAEPTVTIPPRPHAPVAAAISARLPGTDWPLTQQDRRRVEPLLTRPPFAPPKRHRRHPGAYDAAVSWLLDWLAGSARRHLAGPLAGQRRRCRRAVLAPHPDGVDG